IRGRLLGILGEWRRLASDPQERERLLHLVEALEEGTSGHFGRALRASGAKDAEALKRLAAEAETDPRSPAAMIVLADMLRPLSPQDVGRLLRAAQERYPGDFWVNTILGLKLLQVDSLSLDQVNSPTPPSEPSFRIKKRLQMSEALGYLRVALA